MANILGDSDGTGTSATVSEGGSKLLLVLGMHRSGTSALTGVLQKLGAELGEELLAPTPDNPKGYFENSRIVDLHESLLHSLARGWQDPRALSAQWRETAEADKAFDGLSALVRSMAKQARFVAVKDPRASRFVPLWLDVARALRLDVGAVLMVRHPNEVAASLRKRDGLSRSRAHLLWMVYLLEAERGSRGVARAFLSYEHLLSSWRQALAGLRDALGDIVPDTPDTAIGEIDGFLDASLRRQKVGELDEGVSPFEPLALELFGLALRGAANPADDLSAAFDSIARRLEPLAAHYHEGPLPLEQEIQRQREHQVQVDTTLQFAAVRELWRPSLPVLAPGPARLYFQVGTEPFSEDRVVSAEPVCDGNRRVVVFEIPEGQKFDTLRIDPDSRPGIYALESLLICGRAVEPLHSRISGLNEFPFPSIRASDACRIGAIGDDPHFVVDVQDQTQTFEPGTMIRVEVRYRVETVLSEVGGHIEDYREALQAHGRELANTQQGLDAALNAALQELAGMRQGLESGLRELERREARLQPVVDAIPDVVARQKLLVSLVEATTLKVDELRRLDLARMEQQQEVLLTWVRRRSFGYWWRRLTRRGRSG